MKAIPVLQLQSVYNLYNRQETQAQIPPSPQGRQSHEK